MTFEHERELPGEIVRILNAGVTSKAAVQRHDVGGVAGDEHPAGLGEVLAPHRTTERQRATPSIVSG